MSFSNDLNARNLGYLEARQSPSLSFRRLPDFEDFQALLSYRHQAHSPEPDLSSIKMSKLPIPDIDFSQFPDFDDVCLHEIGHADKPAWIYEKSSETEKPTIERVTPTKYSGFFFDDVEKLIKEADDEMETLETLFDPSGNPLFEFKQVHFAYAYDRRYLVLADLIEGILDSKTDPEDCDYTEEFNIDIPLRTREAKKEDAVTSIIKSRFDDVTLLKKVRRLSHIKLNVHHAMLARKQDLPETEKYIRKILS